MHMIDYLIYFLACIITIPFVATVLIYIVCNKIYSSKWKAVHRAVNWTTILYIVAVTILLTIIFHRDFIGIILLLLLSMLVGIIFIQWKINTEVELKKAIKIVWRMSFLLFLFAYILLVLVGILQRIFN